MGSIWSLYENKLFDKGYTKRDRVIGDLKKHLHDESVDNPAFKQIMVDDVELGVYMKNTDEDDKKVIQLLPDETIDLGSVISYKDMFWIVVSVNFNDEVYRSATIRQCNRLIKWQNPKTEEILERWCFVNKPYTANISDGKVITALSGRYDVQLPYDSETVLLDVGKRFMFDIIDDIPKCYIIEFADINTYKYEQLNSGLIEWTIVSDTYDPNTDNKEFMICDYKKPHVPEPPISKELTSIAIGDDKIINGYSEVYSPEFYDINENLVKNILPIWNIDYKDIPMENIAIENVNDFDVKISVVENQELINKTFDLLLKDVDGNSLESRKEIKVVSLFG